MNRLEIFEEVYCKDYVFTETELSRLQQVAELIVRECAEVVQEGRWMVPPTQEQLARSIKRHFGVEG